MTIEIGECRFDSLRREVRRGTERVHLSPKAFELLGLLLERRPRAVSKDELFTLLWPKTFVTEASLAGLVAEIRREIRDDARVPRYLRTVHGFGYAFSADGVANAEDEASRLPSDLGHPRGRARGRRERPRPRARRRRVHRRRHRLPASRPHPRGGRPGVPRGPGQQERHVASRKPDRRAASPSPTATTSGSGPSR